MQQLCNLKKNKNQLPKKIFKKEANISIPCSIPIANLLLPAEVQKKVQEKLNEQVSRSVKSVNNLNNKTKLETDAVNMDNNDRDYREFAGRELDLFVSQETIVIEDDVEEHKLLQGNERIINDILSVSNKNKAILSAITAEKCSISVQTENNDRAETTTAPEQIIPFSEQKNLKYPCRQSLGTLNEEVHPESNIPKQAFIRNEEEQIAPLVEVPVKPMHNLDIYSQNVNMFPQDHVVPNQQRRYNQPQYNSATQNHGARTQWPQQNLLSNFPNSSMNRMVAAVSKLAVASNRSTVEVSPLAVPSNRSAVEVSPLAVASNRSAVEVSPLAVASNRSAVEVSPLAVPSNRSAVEVSPLAVASNRSAVEVSPLAVASNRSAVEARQISRPSSDYYSSLQWRQNEQLYQRNFQTSSHSERYSYNPYPGVRTERTRHHPSRRVQQSWRPQIQNQSMYPEAISQQQMWPTQIPQTAHQFGQCPSQAQYSEESVQRRNYNTNYWSRSNTNRQF